MRKTRGEINGTGMRRERQNDDERKRKEKKIRSEREKGGNT